MRLMRVSAIAKKEGIQIIRDPYSLAMAFLMPVMLLFIFGYAITLDVDNLPTVVYDRDKSSTSRGLVAQFRESRYFTVVAYAEDHADIDRYIDRGRAKVAISIPEDFSKNMATGRDATIQVAVDGSDSNTATIALGYIAAISDLYSQRTCKALAAPAIDPRVRVWYNPELRSRNFIMPGLIAVVMAIIAALLSSLTISREWERGTMEQLISTPVKPHELIIGKLSAYFVIGFVDVLVAALIGIHLFDVPLKGSPLLLMMCSSLFLFGGLSLGIFISAAAKSQLLASQVSLITSYLPALLLSGFMFSISNMPAPLQLISHIVPARYFVAMLKSIYLKGGTLKLLIFETAALAVFGILTFMIANKKFRKRID
ncbi:MAG TPA: ABC transporter permease [Syntrophorhabdaceae bacterium]|nr:ABC transporter permease [Syntrophorhabdaceae bacterium]HQM80477.1 ABC transporter permease [Syntrophorhabdaceae bacterium]